MTTGFPRPAAGAQRADMARRRTIWFLSTAFHVGLAALILARTPFGLQDVRHTRLAQAPQVELGFLPHPLPEPSPEPMAAETPQDRPLPAVDPSQAETVQEPLKAEPAETATAFDPPVEPAPSPLPVLPTLPDADAPSVLPPARTIEKTPPAKPLQPKTATAREHKRPAAPSRRTATTMTETHSATANLGAMRASYGALLRAEIMRRRFYPPDAASRGDEGTVIARVTIGPGGRPISHGIARSSGNPALDRTIPTIMARVSLPPPPGGSFSATVAIRFALD